MSSSWMRPHSATSNHPPGFRVVSYSQAMMEYAGPVLEASESEDIKELNERMQIAMKIWNHGIAGELIAGPRPSEKEIIHNIGKVLKISKQEAAEFFKKMVEWKSYLFPEELQQKGVPLHGNAEGNESPHHPFRSVRAQSLGQTYSPGSKRTRNSSITSRN